MMKKMKMNVNSETFMDVLYTDEYAEKSALVALNSLFNAEYFDRMIEALNGTMEPDEVWYTRHINDFIGRDMQEVLNNRNHNLDVFGRFMVKVNSQVFSKTKRHMMPYLHKDAHGHFLIDELVALKEAFIDDFEEVFDESFDDFSKEVRTSVKESLKRFL